MTTPEPARGPRHRRRSHPRTPDTTGAANPLSGHSAPSPTDDDGPQRSIVDEILDANATNPRDLDGWHPELAYRQGIIDALATLATMLSDTAGHTAHLDDTDTLRVGAPQLWRRPSHPNPACPLHGTDQVLIGCPCSLREPDARPGDGLFTEPINDVGEALCRLSGPHRHHR